jgi:dihydroorotase/N-acyl-D-amino-acid deacylase
MRAWMVAVAGMLAAPATGAVPEAPYDLVFAGGRVADGSGRPMAAADVGVRGDRIAAVGDLSRAVAKRRIDARRLVIAPGFIDMLGWSEYNVLVDNRAASKITQGITTEITGEGHSIAPQNAAMIAADRAVFAYYGVTPSWTTLAGYFAELAKRRATINLGTFVGAGGVREYVMGRDNRPPTPAEMTAMEAQVAQAMEEGALGLSTSLLYVPDRFASTAEIIALARVARRFGGTYITHQRDEGTRIAQSLDEVFRIAREAAIPAEIWHLKVAGRQNWGRMPEVLARIEKARAEGLEIGANMYPWMASSNALHTSLPAWARAGTTEAMVARLRDPAVRARVRPEVRKAWGRSDGSHIRIANTLDPALAKYEGRSLADIARAEGKDAVDMLMDIVIADRGNSGKISFTMSEDDIRTALRHPLVSIGTDAGASAVDGIFATRRSHPRAWGTMSRILGRYVRQEKLIPLEEAVRKMTSLPAGRMKLQDRGLVKVGYLADLVAFDPETVADRSTYANPWAYSVGIPFVVVNGELVVDGGAITAARPGRILRGPGWARRGRPISRSGPPPGPRWCRYGSPCARATPSRPTG